MFKTCIIFALLGCLSLQQSCNTTQYWSIITSVSSIYPSQPIIDSLDQKIKLDDIEFDVETQNFRITNIVAQPLITGISYTSTGNVEDITIPTSFYVTFKIVNSIETVTSVGSGFIKSADIMVSIIQGTSIAEWSVQNVTFIESNLVEDVNLSNNVNYNAIVAALNTVGKIGYADSVPNQIRDLLFEREFTLNPVIQTYLDNKYNATYEYTYKNINGVTQKIVYDTTVLSSSTTDTTLSVQRTLSIVGFNNQCEFLMPQPSTIYEGRQASQITAFSLAQINNTFIYALQNKYFDTQLNRLWNSPIFQFNAGTLQNVISGLRGNFLPNQLSTGKCTANAKFATFVQGKLNQIDLAIPYVCQLYTLGSTSQDELAQATFVLLLSIEISTKSDPAQLVVQGKSAQVLTLVISGSDNFAISNSQLATIYIESVVQNAFIGQNLFGTGFSTLERGLTSTSTITGEDLVVYQYQQNQQMQ